MSYLGRWNEYYQKLKEYSDTFGTTDVPTGYVTQDNYGLGSWVVYQRIRFRSGLLPAEQKKLLDSINMVWNINDSRWDNMYAKLVEYYNEYGNINVSPSYVTKDGDNLGEWLVTFKQAYKGKSKRKISPDQIALFNDLYIDWSPLDTRVLNSEIVPGCCFSKYKKIMLERMKHILEDMSYEVEGNITTINKQKHLEIEIIQRMWR